MRFVILLLLLCGLSGCSGITIKAHANSNINRDINGKASPLTIKLYQLSQKQGFMALDFFSLFQQPFGSLSQQCLAVETRVIVPGQRLQWHLRVKPHAHYLGIIADYRDINHAQWRTLVALKGWWYDYLGRRLTLQVTANGLVVEA